MSNYTELECSTKSVAEIVPILDDASAMGFEIVIESGKVFYREMEN